MKLFLSLTLTLAICEGVSWAQTIPPTPPDRQSHSMPAPDADALKSAQDLMRVDMLWTKPIDWQEKSATTADIIAHVQKALGKDTVIQMRGKDFNFSTFELPQSPLGPTLSSLALLANSRVWVFPGRLLFAPETTLTQAEKDAIKAGIGGEWKESVMAGGRGWNARAQWERLSLILIGTDLKEKFAAKGLAPIEPPPPPPAETLQQPDGTKIRRVTSFGGQVPLPYELPLSELSSGVKAALHNLFDANREMFVRFPAFTSDGAPIINLVLNDATLVSFDDNKYGRLELRLAQVDPQNAEKKTQIARWSASVDPMQ